MKRTAFVSLLALAACAGDGPAAAPPVSPLVASIDFSPESLKALGAICGSETLGVATTAPDIKLAGGFGAATMKADTTNKAAQDWFDYGLRLSDGFYHEDAKAAMKKAVAADPDCSICAWGLAWSLGPTLNYGFVAIDKPAAMAAAENARKLAKPGDDKARRLAEAIVTRFTTEKEPPFGIAMKAIAETYPDDVELTVLATHALLIPVRSDDKSGLKPALAMLEAVLKAHPDDSGAIHYYIHATEFDGRAIDALPYAQKLGRLTPAASHMVHMPAHTMIHAGLYEQAALVNAEAIEADAKWIKSGGDPRAPTSGTGAAARLRGAAGLAPPPMYYGHNLGFGLAGALMAGDAKLSLKYVDNAAIVWPNDKAVKGGTPVHRTYVALARYAPDKALALPELNEPKLILYRHYARGEALMLKGDAAGARVELKALAAMKGDIRKSPEWRIAQDVLAGRIALAQGRTSEAARLFERAAKLQETKLSDSWDPPGWWYPVRRSLAAAWLKAGDFQKAKAEAETSLKLWKLDPLALWVLGKAEIGLGQADAGQDHLSQARGIWQGRFDSITAEAI
jgi:tetratricopeptide (TPR) repeat protein